MLMWAVVVLSARVTFSFVEHLNLKPALVEITIFVCRKEPLVTEYIILETPDHS